MVSNQTNLWFFCKTLLTGSPVIAITACREKQSSEKTRRLLRLCIPRNDKILAFPPISYVLLDILLTAG